MMDNVQALNSIAIAVDRACVSLVDHIRATAIEMVRPFYQLKPKLSRDGNQWRFLYGENLQEGIAGFGETPELAARDFDRDFFENRAPSNREGVSDA